MTITDGNPAGGDAGNGTQTPRDGDNQQGGSQASRNATDDAARDGRSDSDDLEDVDDPKRLREMIREMRGHERRRNEGYNTQQATLRQTQERLAALEKERQQGQPLEERLKALEKELADEREKNTKIEQERKDERTNEGLRAAAARLNAIDPEDVVRLLDRADLNIEDNGTPTNAEQVVRAFLRKKPQYMRGGGGSADGGSRGSSGKGDTTDMNNLLRNARRGRVAPGGKDTD